MKLSDPGQSRLAMRNVPACVSIATTRDQEGCAIGVTIGSLSSLSLVPTLLLWSLQKTSRAHAVFREGGPFAVSVLAAHKSDLAYRFANCDGDRFSAGGDQKSPLSHHQGRFAEVGTLKLYGEQRG
jgi:flavin reductase (DIM6/NTAB) family NADH-FMN oxidoreductase RutF